MTTEEDFRRALDANSDDWQTLAVFSDWLRDRDDARADGYAALAHLRRKPMCWNRNGENWFGWVWEPDSKYPYIGNCVRSEIRAACLPQSWWLACKTEHTMPCECFDSAARAFAKLSDKYRAELLQTSPP